MAVTFLAAETLAAERPFVLQKVEMRPALCCTWAGTGKIGRLLKGCVSFAALCAALPDIGLVLPMVV